MIQLYHRRGDLFAKKLWGLEGASLNPGSNCFVALRGDESPFDCGQLGTMKPMNLDSSTDESRQQIA